MNDVIFDAEKDITIDSIVYNVYKTFVLLKEPDGYGFGSSTVKFDGYHSCDFDSNSLIDGYNTLDKYLSDGYNIIDGYFIEEKNNDLVLRDSFISLDCSEIKEKISNSEKMVQEFESIVSKGQGTKEIVYQYLPHLKKELNKNECLLNVLRSF